MPEQSFHRRRALMPLCCVRTVLQFARYSASLRTVIGCASVSVTASAFADTSPKRILKTSSVWCWVRCDIAQRLGTARAQANMEHSLVPGELPTFGLAKPPPKEEHLGLWDAGFGRAFESLLGGVGFSKIPRKDLLTQAGDPFGPSRSKQVKWCVTICLVRCCLARGEL